MSANPDQVQEVLEEATARLAPVSDSPRLDAEVLLAQVLGKPRSYLYTWPEKTVEAEDRGKFRQLLQRREQGEPIAHIVGEREFWSLDLKVTPDTLIPRPETELLVELALGQIPVKAIRSILDLGTGSGAIALAIARERPDCTVTAVERSSAALEVARENAQRLAIGNVEFLEGEWYAPVQDRRFHIIVSNPPYIANEDPHLQQGDVRYEPRSALVAGVEGLDDIREIVRMAPAHLVGGGILMLEHGFQQAEAVRQLMKKQGFTPVYSRSDLAGNDRVTVGFWQNGD